MLIGGSPRATGIRGQECSSVCSHVGRVMPRDVDENGESGTRRIRTAHTTDHAGSLPAARVAKPPPSPAIVSDRPGSDFRGELSRGARVEVGSEPPQGGFECVHPNRCDGRPAASPAGAPGRARRQSRSISVICSSVRAGGGGAARNVPSARQSRTCLGPGGTCGPPVGRSQLKYAARPRVTDGMT